MAKLSEEARKLVGDHRIAVKQVVEGYINRWGWATPDYHVAKWLVEWLEGCAVLEVGAGRGLWAAILGAAGVNIVVTEPKPPQTGHLFCPHIEHLDWQEAFKQHPECDTLMLCWPDGYGLDAIKAWKGDRIVYVGEGREGELGSGGAEIVRYLTMPPTWHTDRHITRHTIVAREHTLFCKRGHEPGEDADGSD